jgi:UDP-N-acetylbacillosamine N-acetyltransferase
VGEGCIINMNAVVDHDCLLEDGVHICLGAIVKAGIIIKNNVKVEAGEVIRKI